MTRFAKLVKKYRTKYNLSQANARKLAKAAISRKPVFGLKGSLGIKTPKKHP